MGCFSWMYADRAEKPLYIENEAYLLNPHGENYYEESYDGYGHFAGKDVYELALDWNREYIPEMIRQVKQGTWRCRVSEREMQNLKAFAEGRPLACEKRDLGICLACYDEDNAKLPYPIKVCKTDTPYRNVGPSDSDPGQGFGDLLEG